MFVCPVCQLKCCERQEAVYCGYSCQRCGEFTLDLIAAAILGQPAEFSERQRANLSGWLYAHPGSNLARTSLLALRDLPTPNVHAMADMLLVALAKQTESFGQAIAAEPIWCGWASCLNESELKEVIALLTATNRLSRVQEMAVPAFKITPDGWLRLEDVKRKGTDSQQGFIAMWFHECMDPIEQVISDGITTAGYRARRVDRVPHINKIDDEIMAQIRRSRFVVADLTGHRTGVYYEAGFAMGLQLPVFWTCREKEMKRLHFDIRQYNCIGWDFDDLPEFQKRLKYGIESVLGHGTYQATQS